MLERFERFSYGIAEISKYWHKLTTEEMAKYHLKGTHCTYLLALAKAKEGLTAPQLCEICGKDKSDVSRMMKILETKELVVKTGEHQNRYGGVFQLTEQGQIAADGVCKKASRAVEIAGCNLTEEQRSIFYFALDSIAVNLRRMSEEGMLNDESL